MNRSTLATIVASGLLLLTASALFARFVKFTATPPLPTSGVHIEPPPSWAFDCEKVRQNVSGSQANPTLTVEPLERDAVSIYKILLQQWRDGSPSLLNVSDKTVPLNVSHEGWSCDCIAKVDVENLLAASRRFHRIPSGVLSRVKLIDQKRQMAVIHQNDPNKTMREGKSVNDAVAGAYAAGLVTLSEVAFDKEHRRALVQFSIHCGALCGSGHFVLLEKTGQTWTMAKQSCGGWIA